MSAVHYLFFNEENSLFYLIKQLFSLWFVQNNNNNKISESN